jgi:hypothetical protein
LDSTLNEDISASGYVLLSALCSNHRIIWRYMDPAIENVMTLRKVMHDSKDKLVMQPQ